MEFAKYELVSKYNFGVLSEFEVTFRSFLGDFIYLDFAEKLLMPTSIALKGF